MFLAGDKENGPHQKTTRRFQQEAIEQILEDERWRTDLTDAEAKVLLNWSIEQAKNTFADAQSLIANSSHKSHDEGQKIVEDTNNIFQARLRHLRGAMGAIASLAAQDDPITAEQIVEELEPYLPIPPGYKKLLSRFISRTIASQIAQASEGLDKEERIRLLTSFVEIKDKVTAYKDTQDTQNVQETGPEN